MPPRIGGITMLGAQATGKTTFLAALQIALLRRGTGWSLRGSAGTWRGRPRFR
jgi:hypothetical protein